MGSPAIAAQAVNALGIDLLTKVMPPGENGVLSPYSIQSVLAMSYAGSSGETKTEMAQVLHFPADDRELHRSFAALRRGLDVAQTNANVYKRKPNEDGESTDPFILKIATRLFGQEGYDFRPEFRSILKAGYRAPFQTFDFRHSSERVRNEINRWVSKQTFDRIAELIPPGGVNADTRLALVNAIYFKATWTSQFDAFHTSPEPFFVGGSTQVNVQTMKDKQSFSYLAGDDYLAIAISYTGQALQLLVILPDKKDGLAALEKKLTPALLASFANMQTMEFRLHLPKFKFEPPLLQLSAGLKSLGMRTAFNEPEGSADFDRMAPRGPNGYLFLSEVFHRAFIEVDEKGTEAVAATALIAAGALSVGAKRPPPIDIKVDHPFIFAIQHRPSGACLFIGRVVDPR